MWALFNWACKGKLLGPSKTFKSDFEEPIVRASHRKATLREKQYGEQIAARLREHIKPHFLRREKKDIFPTTPQAAKHLQTPKRPQDKKEKEQDAEGIGLFVASMVLKANELQKQKKKMITKKWKKKRLKPKNRKWMRIKWRTSQF